MANKATHYGHCQICGSRQLLPSGVLAKHGYTTRWGFFSGTCNGSGFKPFEQATNLIEDASARAEAEAANLREQATALRADSTGTKTWVTVYDSATWKDRTSRTRWVEVELTEEVKTIAYGDGQHTFTVFHYTEEARQSDGSTRTKVKQFERGGFPKTLAEAVAAGRKDRAAGLDGQASQYDSYAKWQRTRIAGWKPVALAAR